MKLHCKNNNWSSDSGNKQIKSDGMLLNWINVIFEVSILCSYSAYPRYVLLGLAFKVVNLKTITIKFKYRRKAMMM